MQVSIENTGSLQRKLTVRLPAERVESRVRERISELGRTVRLKGFRPGKVPAKVIEQRFGQQVRNEALSEVIRSSFQEVVQQEKLRPAMAPSITSNANAPAGEIEFTATFEVVPEIGPIDVSGIEVVRTVAAVSDADVDRMIDTLRMQRRSFSPVERGAAANDMAVFDYSATTAGGRHPAEGMDRAGTIIGSGAFLAAFEEALVGAKAGETRRFDVTFPAGFREAALAGQAAQVEVQVLKVQEAHLPAVDDAFIATFGVRDGGLERFRNDVRSNLERELEGTLRARVKAETMDRLVKAYQSLEVPAGMVAAEARAMLAQAQQHARQAGADVPQSPQPFEAAASRRVRAFLLLNEIGAQNSIQVDQRRVADTLAVIASTYEEPEKVVELYSRDAELMHGLRNRVMEEQALDWILAHAHVSERPSTFEQVMQPGTART
jgi:trigger factor